MKGGIILKMLKSKKGFTLMEMLIVVTIIGILAAVVLPRFITSSGSAKKSAHKTERQTINSQLELYYFVFSSYPTVMTNVAWGTTDQDNNGTIDYKEYFPEGVPTTCNYGSAWALTEGRVKASDHSAHE